MKTKQTDQELYDLFSTVVADQARLPYAHKPIEVRCQNIDELKSYADFCQQVITDVHQLISVVLPNLSLDIDRQQYDALRSACTKTLLNQSFNVLQGDSLIVYFKNSVKKSFELQGLDLSMDVIGTSLDYAKSMWEAQAHLLTVCLTQKEACMDFIKQMSACDTSSLGKVNEKIQMKNLRFQQRTVSSPVCKGIEIYTDFLKLEKKK